jgi:DNA-binding MarR family transcriptional regulator
MDIKKEIQQVQAFRNDYHKAIVNIMFSSSWLSEKIKDFLDSEDITPQQYNILRILRGNHLPMSTMEIRVRMLDKMSDTSRIVERILKKGLVEKRVSVKDKRLVDINISRKGITLLEKLDTQNNQLDNILNGLNIEEAVLLNELLDKMRDRS